MPIQFHNADISFRLRRLRAHRQWIEACIAARGKQSGALNIIFTSNPYLLKINRKYLNHNYFTDVITFDYTEKNMLAGDVFISIDKVRENAGLYGVGVEDEIRRVMVHGMLHLAGFSDATDAQREIMREMENDALHLWLKLEK